MIDFSKKLRRIVCILARWDVRLRFTIPSPDTSERVLEIIDNVGTRLEQGGSGVLCQTRASRAEPGPPLLGVSGGLVARQFWSA